MLIKQLDNDPAKNKFSISYIDKNEATFILGLLKPISCTYCPDFYKGCSGGNTLQEVAMTPDKDYIEKHVHGTEGFLCGKLRNIVCLSKAEEQELNNQFEEDFNRRVSLLTKKIGSEEKYVLINDKDEFNNIIRSVEHQMIDRLKVDVEKINKHNSLVVNEMQEKLDYQEKTIKRMQATIRKLKKGKTDEL